MMEAFFADAIIRGDIGNVKVNIDTVYDMFVRRLGRVQADISIARVKSILIAKGYPQLAKSNKKK